LSSPKATCNVNMFSGIMSQVAFGEDKSGLHNSNQ